MQTIITVTDRASDFIKQKLDAKPGSIFRLTVKKTGCSGYSYAPAITEQRVEGDVQQAMTNGITLYLDSAWITLLEGVTVDYVEDKLGIKQKKLVFINPKEASRCGCGESFHLE